MSTLFETINESFKNEGQKEGDDKAYDKYFAAKLKKGGYKSVGDIPKDKKDDFFNDVDKGWKSDGEGSNEGKFCRDTGKFLAEGAGSKCSYDPKTGKKLAEGADMLTDDDIKEGKFCTQTGKKLETKNEGEQDYDTGNTGDDISLNENHVKNGTKIASIKKGDNEYKDVVVKSWDADKKVYNIEKDGKVCCTMTDEEINKFVGEGAEANTSPGGSAAEQVVGNANTDGDTNDGDELTNEGFDPKKLKENGTYMVDKGSIEAYHMYTGKKAGKHCFDNSGAEIKLTDEEVKKFVSESAKRKSLFAIVSEGMKNVDEPDKDKNGEELTNEKAVSENKDDHSNIKIGEVYRYTKKGSKGFHWDPTDKRMVIIADEGAYLRYDVKTNEISAGVGHVWNVDVDKGHMEIAPEKTPNSLIASFKAADDPFWKKHWANAKKNAGITVKVDITESSANQSLYAIVSEGFVQTNEGLSKLSKSLIGNLTAELKSIKDSDEDKLDTEAFDFFNKHEDKEFISKKVVIKDLTDAIQALKDGADPEKYNY